MARALADAGLNIAFLMAQVIGRRFTAAIGFADAAAADAAVRVVKQAATKPRPSSTRRRRRR
jgi:hypothetical protein